MTARKEKHKMKTQEITLNTNYVQLTTVEDKFCIQARGGDIELITTDSGDPAPTNNLNGFILFKGRAINADTFTGIIYGKSSTGSPCLAIVAE